MKPPLPLYELNNMPHSLAALDDARSGPALRILQ